MKIKTFAWLLVSLGMLAVFAQAKSTEPEPIAMVHYKGEDFPVYDVRQVRPKSFPQPRYPDQESRDHVTGEAVIMVVVDVTGRVIETEILSSKPTAVFGTAAQEAVMKWRYPKLTRKGQPTKFMIRQVISFDIQN